MSVPRSARIRYYLDHIGSWLKPNAGFRKKRSALLSEAADLESVQRRAEYYMPIREPFALSQEARPFRCRPWKKRSTYQLDLWEPLRYFPPEMQLDVCFGDNILNPSTPTIVKSRPISPQSNGVLLKLNQLRHFRFVQDTLPFREKKNQLVWRGNAAQPHRIAFLEQFYHHPQCDVGHFYERPVENMPFKRPELSVSEQLRYKFIFALEGNDVATNLKWICSSNSLCFMPPPRYETWFMEGKLEPGVHYVEVAADYSNLEAQLDYYIHHPEEAETIIQHANQWVQLFQNPRTELLTGLEVLHRYFQLSGQM